MDNSGFIPRAPGKGNITAIRPKTWNAIADVVNGGRVGANGPSSPAVADGLGKGWVWVKNTSGSDRSRFDCMALGDPTMALTTDGQVDVVFAATTADPVKTPAILLEPIANGRVGRAAIYGLCLATVAAGATSLLNAVPQASSNSLLPSASGSIKLLTAPSASVVTLIPVVLGASASPGVVMKTPGGGIAARSGTTISSATCTQWNRSGSTLSASTETYAVYGLSTTAVANSVFIVAIPTNIGWLAVWEDC